MKNYTILRIFILYSYRHKTYYIRYTDKLYIILWNICKQALLCIAKLVKNFYIIFLSFFCERSLTRKYRAILSRMDVDSHQLDYSHTVVPFPVPSVPV